MKGSGGHIVMIGSMSADVREKGSAVYVATKSGIQGFSASLRKEANEAGVGVSLIEPGSVGTDMVDESPAEQALQQEKLEMLTAEDIGRCVLFVLIQPERCEIVSLQVRPKAQII
jgi:NADP-dependent 3-hydroxy acid dehydrogenase YdfG